MNLSFYPPNKCPPLGMRSFISSMLLSIVFMLWLCCAPINSSKRKIMEQRNMNETKRSLHGALVRSRSRSLICSRLYVKGEFCPFLRFGSKSVLESWSQRDCGKKEKKRRNPREIELSLNRKHPLALSYRRLALKALQQCLISLRRYPSNERV